MTKCHDFANSAWRTAAILKIVIAPYLSGESSEFDDIWYADANFEQGDGNVTKIQKFPNSRWRTDAILKIIFGYNSAPYCPIKTNLEPGGIIARTQRLDDENVKFRKSNMADGRHFETIISPYLSRNLSEFHETLYADIKFNPGDGIVTKNHKFPNSRWRPSAILKIIFAYNSAPACPIKTKFGVRRHNRTHTKIR